MSEWLSEELSERVRWYRDTIQHMMGILEEAKSLTPSQRDQLQKQMKSLK